MLDALELAHSIIRDQPEQAINLLQLIAWVRAGQNDPSHEAQIDAVENFVYSQTDECAKRVEDLKRSWLVREVKANSSAGP